MNLKTITTYRFDSVESYEYNGKTYYTAYFIVDGHKVRFSVVESLVNHLEAGKSYELTLLYRTFYDKENSKVNTSIKLVDVA